MRLAITLIAVLLPAPVQAQEEIVADTGAAVAAGFQIVVPRDEVGHADFATQVDRLVVAPWMRRHAPGFDYSFSLLNRDINDDGFGDVVVSIRTAAHLTDGDGGAVLVSTAQGGGWAEPSLHEAMALGIRDRAGGYGHELALIGADGFDVY